MGQKYSFRSELNRNELHNLFPEILALSKMEANPLGFIPSGGMQSAIEDGRLFALIEDANEGRLAGYIFYGGVFPSAKIFQVAVAPEFRRQGVGSALIATLTSRLEELSYFSIVADIRDDLDDALAFYRENGFVEVSRRAGGKTRGRDILTYVKELDSDDLFSAANAPKSSRLATDIHRIATLESPHFSLDINVYFDLAKRRKFACEAESLFRAALSGIVRLSVSSEFVIELRKHVSANTTDPILNMALCIPRLPATNAMGLEQLAKRVHRIVFEDSGSKYAGSNQAMSDARHLAHSAMARCTAFVTRDQALLDAGKQLFQDLGVEIVSPLELFALLPVDLPDYHEETAGTGFKAADCSADDARQFITGLGGRKHLYDPFLDLIDSDRAVIRCIGNHGRFDAVAVLNPSRIFGGRDRLAIACRPEHPDRRLYVDYLMDASLRDAAIASPTLVSLLRIPGQSTVNEVARARGFTERGASRFEKAVIGSPMHDKNWGKIAGQLSARTGIGLPNALPRTKDAKVEVTSKERSQEFLLVELEKLLGPTLIWAPGRDAVIAPITKGYASELLGVGENKTFDFMEARDAAFRSVRGYVSSPRNSMRMAAGSIVFFYESKREGGRGAIVAVASIVSSTVEAKDLITRGDRDHLVVDSFDDFSKSEEVLVTKFENLFPLRQPVYLNQLRALGAADGANFVTARPISATQARQILQKGFPA